MDFGSIYMTTSLALMRTRARAAELVAAADSGVCAVVVGSAHGQYPHCKNLHTLKNAAHMVYNESPVPQDVLRVHCEPRMGGVHEKGRVPPVTLTITGGTRP